jgi:antitoxin CptB
MKARPATSGFLALSRMMTGTTHSSDGLDIRRRKLLFRAWHRGMREMDLIVGRFADRTIDALTEAELTEFERLIEVPDRELLAWITGEADIPAIYDGPLLRRLREFQLSGEGAR